LNLKALRLLKIDIDDSVNVKEKIQHAIIANKLKSIERKLPKTYLKYLKIVSDTVSDRKARILFSRGRKLASINYFDSIRRNLSSNSRYCLEATLTSSKIASLLGYKSSMQGYNVLKRLETLNMVNVKRNRTLFISSNSLLYNYTSDSSFFLTSNGNLIKQLPNLITSY